jgi:hypothetical protein
MMMEPKDAQTARTRELYNPNNNLSKNKTDDAPHPVKF